MTDYRALCARMADELDYYRQLLMDDRREVHALATEARAALAEADKQEERPNRLRKGDMWEFWTEVRVKGKQKPVEKLLQWEVIGWHHGEQAWELLSLDGEHKEYLMEFAPSYEDMRFLGVKSQ